MRTRLGLLLVLGTWACGSSEPPPELAPEAAPPPSVEPPPAPVTPEEPAAPTPPTNEVDPLEPAFDELERVDTTFELHHVPVHYDQVAYAAPVQEALLRQLRAVARDLTVDFEPSMSGDEDYEATFYADCDATLALPTLVSYRCVVNIDAGRGMTEIYAATRLWAIDGETIRELENDDFLVEGVDTDLLDTEYELETGGPAFLTPSTVGFVDWQGEWGEIPYEDLGTLLRPGSAVLRVPGVDVLAAVQTPLATRAGPPELVTVALPPRPIGEAALALARATDRSPWLFPAQIGGALDATSAAVTLTPAGATATEERPWSAPLRVAPMSLRRATALREAPRRSPTGEPLPRRTAVWALLGDTAAGPSRTGAGQWTLIVASPGIVGWVSGGVLDRPIEGEPLAALDAARAARPGDVSDGTFVVSLESGHAAISRGTPLTTVVVVGGYPLAVSTIARWPGALREVHRVPTASGSPSALLVTSWLVPDTGQVRLIAQAIAPEAGAPLLDLTLPGPDAPTRERVTPTFAVTRRRTYYPIVLRGPGRQETLYTWNGTALVTSE